MRCSVLQCVAACVAVCCSGLTSRGVQLEAVAVRCSTLQRDTRSEVAVSSTLMGHFAVVVCCICVAACCSSLKSRGVKLEDPPSPFRTCARS